ncbi:uncharacterized protein LOC129581230 [Paramacrobiotus metropolitanus]|uniref:uncharacterized protein LOC129581230 n=1 Tax=Paramacrobiotus metropolitanus TaxID=2943436 RepID=UPI00244640CB|nr:uncharacterized protein LOC129581230 [Paramacrobiotus metropolitanus]
MGAFRNTVLFISLLVYTGDCETPSKIKIPYDRIQIQVFSKISDRTPLFYAPVGRLLTSTLVSASVTIEPNTNCLFGSVTITRVEDEWAFTGFARDQASWLMYLRVQAKLPPFDFKWMLVGYSTNDSTPTTTTSAWQFLTNWDPTASVRIACPTDATYNDTMRDDSGIVASRLFVAFAIDSSVRSTLLCIDTTHLPNNTIVNFVAERLSAGQNHVFMSAKDYNSFTKTLVAGAVEKLLGENEFVEDDEMERLERERKMEAVFPYNCTTTANFTSEMWEATFSSTERPDVKARRLDAVLSDHGDWVREMLNGIHSTAPIPVMQAYNEVLEDDDLYFTDIAKYTSGKVHLKELYVFYVNLEVLRQKTPICIGNVTITPKSANYTAAVPADVGDKIVFNDGTSL